jgi:MFS family permease
MMRKNVWSKNFTLITIGTIISAIAGQAISLPLSLIVFDKTQSTLLSAILFVVGIIPNVILPILIAPIIDRTNKKRIIVSLDYVIGIFYLGVAYMVKYTGFNYNVFLGISLITGIIGSIYQLAYQSWFPDLIPIGYEQQGYAVSSSIYPTVMIVMTPIATYLYKAFSIEFLFVLIGILTIIAASFELCITNINKEETNSKFNIKDYYEELRGGFRFLKNERGIVNIYTYMSITNGVGNGLYLMIQAYFQTTSYLTVTMLAFLKSMETLGRIIGGIFQYRIKVPPKNRYGITKFVYIFYENMDLILLFLPYQLMLVNRFLCGALGMTSATLRETSVQSYLPTNMRAKVNAVFNVFMSLFIIIFQIISGYLGDLFGYRKVAVVLTVISLISIVIFIIIPDKANRKVYEAVRAE